MGQRGGVNAKTNGGIRVGCSCHSRRRCGRAGPLAPCASRGRQLPRHTERGAARGGHWYYRVDEVGNRRCWYLGPEGASSARPGRRSCGRAQPATQAGIAAERNGDRRDICAFVARETDPTATVSMLSPALPTSAHAVDGEPASASDGAAGGLPAASGGRHAVNMARRFATDLASAGPPGWPRGPILAYVAAALATRHDRPRGFPMVRHSTTSPPSPGPSRAIESGIVGDALVRAGLAGIRRHGRGAPPGAASSQVSCGTAHRRNPTSTGR